MEAAHAVGTAREDDVTEAELPGLDGGAVDRVKAVELAKGFDASPFVDGSELRGKGATEASGVRSMEGTLGANGAPAKNGDAPLYARVAVVMLHVAKTGGESLTKVGKRKSGGRGQGEGDVVGQEAQRGARGVCTSLSKVNARLGDDALFAGEQAKTGPVMAFVGEMGGDGVVQNVEKFAQDIFVVRETDIARRAAVPEVFGAAVVGIECFADKAVQKVAELGKPTVGVGDDAVPVVGQDARGVQNNAGALGSEGEAVGKDVVDGLAGHEEKLTLGAAAGHHIGRPLEDATRLHIPSIGVFIAEVAR